MDSRIGNCGKTVENSAWEVSKKKAKTCVIVCTRIRESNGNGWKLRKNSEKTLESAHSIHKDFHNSFLGNTVASGRFTGFAHTPTTTTTNLYSNKERNNNGIGN